LAKTDRHSQPEPKTTQEERLMSKTFQGPSRRTILTVGAGAAATAAFPMPAVHAQAKELRFLNAEPAVDSVRALRVAAAQYEKEKGVKVTIDTVPSGDAYTRTVAAIKGGRPTTYRPSSSRRTC
jgi:multiple sugar transport system substrate-binding protein